jgi:hypothetical protein
MAYVIACGDEGVQINEGTRLAFAGAGFRMDGFSDVIPLLKKIFSDDIRIASNQESDWMKSKLELKSWEQVNASAQQHIEALADREGLLYAGYFPFADPKQLHHDIKGHMVRPQGVHIANKICFTLSGGEQTYNLGNYVISADWVSQAPVELVRTVIEPQIAFYEQLNGGKPLIRVVEEKGALGEEAAAANKAVLANLGFI